jgi:hypothetical protein
MRLQLPRWGLGSDREFTSSNHTKVEIRMLITNFSPTIDPPAPWAGGFSFSCAGKTGAAGVLIFAPFWQQPKQEPSWPTNDDTRPAAIQVLQRALNQMGGTALWQTVHGARIKGTITYLAAPAAGPGSGLSSGSHPIEWVDDWSSRLLQ